MRPRTVQRIDKFNVFSLGAQEIFNQIQQISFSSGGAPDKSTKQKQDMAGFSSGTPTNQKSMWLWKPTDLHD